jgi:hypothetical protein
MTVPLCDRSDFGRVCFRIRYRVEKNAGSKWKDKGTTMAEFSLTSIWQQNAAAYTETDLLVGPSSV